MSIDSRLDSAGVRIERPRFVALVDRSLKVQALLLLWGSAGTVRRLVGAAPVSTGLPGRFEHFAAPLGVFDHSVTDPDYRAEGTKNEFDSMSSERPDWSSQPAARRASNRE